MVVCKGYRKAVEIAKERAYLQETVEALDKYDGKSDLVGYEISIYKDALKKKYAICTEPKGVALYFMRGGQ